MADASTLLPVSAGPLVQSLTFGHDGKLYGTRLATTGNFFTGAVIEIDTTTGASLRTVAGSITCAGFVVTDPASGDLFVDDSCGGGGSDNGSIWRIADPGSATPATTVYAATPGTNGGMSFATGGTLYVIDYAENAIAQISGTASATPGQKTLLSGISGSALGIVATGERPGGNASTLTLAAAPAADGLPIGIRSFDLDASPALATSLLLTNGYANAQVIGPDQCQYVSMSVAVYKITNADGSCPLRSGEPLLALSPATVSPAPLQGGTQTFSASFHNIDAPAGTAVTFQVGGANAQVRQAMTDAEGIASFVETGVRAGSDTITASATVNGTPLTSVPVQLTWQEGPHASFLNLNRTPTSAMADRPVLLVANLTDVSADPNAPMANATIQFNVDGQSCSGTTDRERHRELRRRRAGRRRIHAHSDLRGLRRRLAGECEHALLDHALQRSDLRRWFRWSAVARRGQGEGAQLALSSRAGVLASRNGAQSSQTRHAWPSSRRVDLPAGSGNAAAAGGSGNHCWRHRCVVELDRCRVESLRSWLDSTRAGRSALEGPRPPDYALRTRLWRDGVRSLPRSFDNGPRCRIVLVG